MQKCCHNDKHECLQKLCFYDIFTWSFIAISSKFTYYKHLYVHFSYY